MPVAWRSGQKESCHDYQPNQYEDDFPASHNSYSTQEEDFEPVRMHLTPVRDSASGDRTFEHPDTEASCRQLAVSRASFSFQERIVLIDFN